MYQFEKSYLSYKVVAIRTSLGAHVFLVLSNIIRLMKVMGFARVST